MTDLLERLRIAALPDTKRHALDCEAADTIEAQAGEIAQMQSDFDATCLALQDEVVRLKAELAEERGQALKIAHNGVEDADSLRAELERLRKDADRYRWLRQGSNLWGICVWEDDEWVQDARTNVDALIDAAMEKP